MPPVTHPALPRPALPLVESDAPDRCAIAVMAKASEPGRVKTRHMPPLSPEQAADLNTAFLRDIVDNLHMAQLSARISPWMAYAPAGSAGFFAAHLPADVRLLETVAPNFGACLLFAVQSLLSAGYRSACVLNSDSPTLPSAYLVTAAIALAADGDRAVIGPSTDGGYYLLGLKTPHRRLFEDIAWSTDRVFTQTLDRAAEIGLPAVVLPPWYDVDDATSIAVLENELRSGRVPVPCAGAPGSPARETQRFLADLAATAAGAHRSTSLKAAQ